MTRPTKHPKTGVYWIRKGVPKALRAAVGKRELIRSLGTKDCAEAKRLAPPILAEFDGILAAARGDALAPALPATRTAGAVSLQAVPTQSKQMAPALKGESLLVSWAAERHPAEATLKKYRGTFRTLARILGFDDVQRITADDVVAFKEARLAEGKDPGTVSDDVLAAGTVCRWAVKNRKLVANPFAEMAPKVNRKGPAPRAPYDDEEAKRILTAARKESGAPRWLPWLLCFTGARLGELAELRRCDVRDEAGVVILDIRPTDARAGKNETMQRMIPLHPAIIEEGFLEYVARLPDDPLGPLFPSVAARKDGTRTTNAQAAHGRWMRNVVGIKDPKKAPAHSWRHRMEDELRKARISHEAQDAITGRHNPRNAGAGYGKGFRGMPDEVLKDLQEVPSPLDPVGSRTARPRADHVSASRLPDQATATNALDAAVSDWFGRELESAYALFRDGSFFAAVIPRGTDEDTARMMDRDATRQDAEGRLERLREAFKVQDYWAGVAGAREIAAALNPPMAAQGQPFDALTKRVMLLLGEVEEARIRWSGGEVEYWPQLSHVGKRPGEAVDGT